MKSFVWLSVLLLTACATSPKVDGASAAAKGQRPAASKPEAAPRSVPSEEKQPTQNVEEPTKPRKKPRYYEED